MLTSESAGRSGRVVDVDLLGTRTDSRGRGLADALLERAVAGAADAGFASAELVVDEGGDPGTLRLYQRASFTTSWRQRVLVRRPTTVRASAGDD